MSGATCLLVHVYILVVPGRTPLHMAALRGQTACCEILLGQDAQLVVRDTLTKATPIHYAGWHMSFSLTTYLLVVWLPF